MRISHARFALLCVAAKEVKPKIRLQKGSRTKGMVPMKTLTQAKYSELVGDTIELLIAGFMVATAVVSTYTLL